MVLLVRLHDGAAFQITELAYKAWAISSLAIFTPSSGARGVTRISGLLWHRVREHVSIHFGLVLQSCSLLKTASVLNDNLMDRGLLGRTVAKSHGLISRLRLLPS